MFRRDSQPEGVEPDPLEGTPYRVRGLLGEGGMGEVYEAEHTELARVVVVKLIRNELVNDPRLNERFRLEAQALARLRHPNVVDVTDFGRTPNGRRYFVMERLRGRNLGQELRARRSIPLHETIEWMTQALVGLHAAHTAGIVHRDIKLENLFLATSPHRAPMIKVLDFGIAKIADAAKTGLLPSAFPTEQGVLVGTPKYMAPEQALGHPVDHRADIYGAGVALYTLIAGRGPFDEYGKELRILAAHATAEPKPPSSYRSEPVPEELDRVVLRALAKDPRARYQTAEQFAVALREVAATLPRPADPALRNGTPPAAVDGATVSNDLPTIQDAPSFTEYARTLPAASSERTELIGEPPPEAPPTRTSVRQGPPSSPTGDGDHRGTALRAAMIMIATALVVCALVVAVVVLRRR